jgi:hypothetical protein
MAGTERLRRRTQLRRSLKRPISPNLFSFHVLSTHSTYSTHLQYFLAEIDRVGHRFSITVYTEEIHSTQIIVLPTKEKVVGEVPD